MQYQASTVWIKKPKHEPRPDEILKELSIIENQLPRIWRARRMLDSELAGLRSERDRRISEIMDMSTDEDTPEFLTKSDDLKSAIKEEYFERITKLKQRISEVENQESALREKHAALRNELLSDFTCVGIHEPLPRIPSQRGL